MAAGSLTLGGNLSITLGPLSRNDETLGSLDTSRKLCAMLVLFLIWTLFRQLTHIPLRSTGIVTVRRKVFSEVRHCDTFSPGGGADSHTRYLRRGICYRRAPGC